jgi:hypothetical protein
MCGVKQQAMRNGCRRVCDRSARVLRTRLALGRLLLQCKPATPARAAKRWDAMRPAPSQECAPHERWRESSKQKHSSVLRCRVVERRELVICGRLRR